MGENRKRVKVYAISDLHGNLCKLDPKGMDLVLLTGDIAPLDSLDDYGVLLQANWFNRVFCPWCASYPQTQFRMIPGNHDLFAQRKELLKQIAWPSNAKLLIDQEDSVNGLRIYGTPWVPFINGYWAFEEPYGGHKLRKAFDAIPSGLDILLTHTPPRIDRRNVDVSMATHSRPFGSIELTDALNRARPRYAICGHIHTGDHRAVVLRHPDRSTTKIRNVSRVDEHYHVAYEPFIFEA